MPEYFPILHNQIMPFFADYYWSEGKPIGIGNGDRYRILSDPYRKRFSIEEYREGKFFRVVYDSHLFDFRQLFKEEEASWQREEIAATNHSTQTLIRDINDRILLKEELFYEKTDCILCNLYSPHGLFLGSHSLFYEKRGDRFNGVLFKDLAGKPVLKKTYALVEGTNEFGTLLHEIRAFPLSLLESL